MPASDQGLDAVRYQVIPRSLIFIFNHQDEVLLIKGAPDKRLWANCYNGIGGHIERGEDVKAAALRELVEETGLCQVELDLRALVMVDVEPVKGVAIFVFCGEYGGDPLQPSEEGSLEWVPLGKLNDYPLVEDLYTLLPVLQDRDPGKVLFGVYSYSHGDELQISFSG